MAESSYCRVCNTALRQKYGDCPYCGYINRLNFTISADDSADYRKKLLHEMRGFSIKANVYQWSDVSNRYEKKKDVELFDPNLNGTDYFNAPVFSKEWIAHSEGKADIKVEYTFGNAKKQAVAQVKLEPKEGIWYLGLHINESLQLEVLLGVMPVGGSRITESKRLCTVDLDFHV